MVNDLLKKYDGDTIRLSLISAHYRQPLNWTKDILEQSKTTLNRIYKNSKEIQNEHYEFSSPLENEFFLEFQESLYDDLNTPKALGILGKFINLKKNKLNVDDIKLTQAINESLKLLGLNKKVKLINKSYGESIEILIEERNQARKQKNFDKADEIREKLKSQNIEIEDTKEGTVWKKLD